MVIVSKSARSISVGRVVALLTLAILVLLIAAVLKVRPGKAPPAIAAENCDASLWQHVYERDRLRVIVPCTAVEGVVASVGSASDGDRHMSLKPQDKSLLNYKNLIHTDDELIVEIVCGAPTSAPIPSAACAGYSSPIASPKPGDRVRVTGAYVADEDHGGWREIHPVSRIEILH